MRKQIMRGLSIIITAALLFSAVSPGIVKAEESKTENEAAQEELVSDIEDNEDGETKETGSEGETDNSEQKSEDETDVTVKAGNEFKSESDSKADVEAESEESDSELDADYIEKHNLANSWRYSNGQPIQKQTRSRAAEYKGPSTWPKVAGAVGYGIDVSVWQGEINWSKVKNDGVDFAIIRCGYGQDQADQDDEYWNANVKGCEANGIPYGVYLYSYADTVAKAKSEAKHVLRLIKGHDLSYPIYYDMEDNVQASLGKKALGDIAEAFCDTIEAAGYKVGIYSSLSWFETKLTDSRFSQWDKWVAQWNDTGCSYSGAYSMWQCSAGGKVDGINGSIDLDIDFGASGKTGFYQDESDQNWYYYKNGVLQSSLTDIIKGTVNGEYAWWYIKNGKVTFTETVAKNKNGWWHVVDGKVDFNSNTVAKNSKGWWVIRDGEVDFDYNGFAQNENGWWYCEDGKVQFGVSDVIKGTVNGTYAWWYVVDGEVLFTETVAKNKNGWWHIQDGKVNFNSNTVAKNSKGWWVIRDGEVDFDYNGFAKNSNGWWYCKGGKVQFGTSSVIKGTVNGRSGWWYVVKGEVIFTETVAKNSNGWWVIQNGKVNFSYNGFAKNSNGWWYCKGGEVQFGRNDVIKGTVNGTKAWWHVVDGEVVFDNTVAKNKNGWWHIQDGKVNFDSNTVAKNKNGWWVIRDGEVNFNYNGFAQNQNGWWYCKGGKVQFKVNDVIKGTVNGTKAWWHVVGGEVVFDNTVAKNKNGWWVIQDGKVNFGYNGFAKNSNGWWYCKDGEVQFGTNGVFSGTVDGVDGQWRVVDGKVTGQA